MPIIFIDNQQTIEDLSENSNIVSNATATDTTLTLTSGYATGSTISILDSEEESSYSLISEFDLIGFLKSDIVGQAILLKSNKQTLSNLDRDRLAELIIKHLVNKYKRLTKEDLSLLANKIEEAIPNEKSSTYFIAPIPKNKSLKNISERSRGKLADKQRNLLWIISNLKKENRSKKDSCNNETEQPSEKGKLKYMYDV